MNPLHLRSRRPRAFSLVELLVVLGIISLLAALLFPVFLSARGKARQIVCASNLRQIGLSITMYMQDYDGRYPYAVDPVDRAWPSAWKPYLPEFATDIPRIGLLHEVLRPYVASPRLFACPADIGFSAIDYPPAPLDGLPSSYEKYGTSYFYRSTLAACRRSDARISFPAQLTVVFDPVGYWHGTLVPLEPRYNMLFADGHVKNLTRSQSDQLWGTPFEGCSEKP